MTADRDRGGASEAEIDLAKVAAAQRLDPDLVLLAGMAEAGGGPVLAFLLSGTLILGRLVDDSALDDVVNQHVTSVFELFGRQSEQPDELRDRAQKLTEERLERTEKRRRKRTELMARYESEVGDADLELVEMATDLARDLIADQARVNLTLADARLFPAGRSGPIEVAVLRVDVRQVGAWWVVPTDPETGSASFTLPE